MDESMRLKILGDSKGAETALTDVERAAQVTADKVVESFKHAGSILKGAIGWTGLAIGLEQSLNDATKLQGLQNTQNTILVNQNIAQQFGLNVSRQQLQNSVKQGEVLRTTLADQARGMSIATGLSQQQLTQAQTLLLTNQDMVKLFKQGGKSDLYNSGVKINANLEQAVTAAANLSVTMGGGGGGSVASSARMLNRMLQDPAKHMSAMTRYGFTLSQEEQNRIKSVEKTNGLIAAQGLLIGDINKHLRNVASNSVTPMEKIKNDLLILKTQLGTNLLPILDALANAIAPIVKIFSALMPSVQGAIKQSAIAIGKYLGALLIDLQPLIDFFLKGVLPMVMTILVPIFKLLETVLQPFVKALNQAMPLITKIMNQIGNKVAQAFAVAISDIAGALKQMSDNGTLTTMMNSLVQSFTNLAPILPAVAQAMAQLIIAFTPAFIAALPTMVQLLDLFTKMLTAIGVPTIKALANAFSALAPAIAMLAPVIGPLLAVWFTKKLFLDPIFGTADAIGLLGGKLGGLVSTMKSVGTGFGVFRTLKGAGAVGERTGVAAEEVIAREKARRGALSQRATLRGKDQLAKDLMKNKTKLETDAEKLLGQTKLTSANGGGLKGFIKNLFGGVGTLTGGATSKDPIDAQNQNTNALINLTNTIERLGGGLFGGGGGGSNSVGNSLKKLGEKVGGKEAKKLAEADVAKALENGVGKSLAKQAGSLTARFLPKLGAGAIGTVAETAAVGGGEIAGVEAGAAALAPETLGLSEVVANVGLAAQQAYQHFKPFHDFVNKGVGLIKDFALGHVKAFETIGKSALSAVGGIGGVLLGSSGKLTSAMLSLGKNMAGSLIGGMKNLAGGVGNLLGSVFGGIGNLAGRLFSGASGFVSGVKNFFGGLMHFHSGGIVPGPRGTEVPAILQAGEAVVSINQMRNGPMNRGVNGINVHPNAVNIVINGNTDNATVNDIKQHVENQFRQLRYAARTLGR